MKNTITILLNKLGVSYTPFYLQKLAQKCNQAQTLSDIKLLLGYYKIDSLAVQIGKEELSEIPLPALVLSSQKDENGRTQNDYSVFEEVNNRYGWLEAEVEQVSLSPQENKYSVQLKLDNGLQTNRNVIVDLNSKSEMYGTVEIVLEERSLLDKFLEQTVYSIEAFE